MKNKFIYLGLAVLAVFCSSISMATDDVRREFYDLVESPRDPMKGLVTIHQDTIFAAPNDTRNIFSTVDGTTWVPVCAFPKDFGNVTRIHSLGTHIVIQEETRSADSKHSKGRVFVLNLTDSQLSKIDTGGDHDWVHDVRQATHPSVFYLNSHSHQSGQSVETCFQYNVTTGALLDIARGPRLGNPIFGEDGNVKFWVNRSHQGPQTLIPVSADGTLLPPIYEQNDPKRVLLDFDPLTGIKEARLHADGRWLPWVSTKGEFGNSETCVWTDCLGSIKHFNVFPDGTTMFNVRMPDGSVLHHLKQAAQPTNFGRDIEFVLQCLGTREVINGPEIKGKDDLPQTFRLITSDGTGKISILHVMRFEPTTPSCCDRLKALFCCAKTDPYTPPKVTELFSFACESVGKELGQAPF